MNNNDLYVNKKGEMLLALISKYMKYSNTNVFRINCDNGSYNIALIDRTKELDISIQSTNSIFLKFKHVSRKAESIFYYQYNEQDDKAQITNRFIDDMDILIGDFIKSKIDYKLLIDDIHDNKLNISISNNKERSNEWLENYKKIKVNKGLEWSR